MVGSRYVEKQVLQGTKGKGMTERFLTRFIAIAWLVLCTSRLADGYTAPQAEAHEKKTEAVITDFEGKKPVAKKSTTHKAIVIVVEEVPE